MLSRRHFPKIKGAAGGHVRVLLRSSTGRNSDFLMAARAHLSIAATAERLKRLQVRCYRTRTSAGGSARAALMSRTILRSVLSAAALALGGCWTAPNANVQPKGEPRLIQSGIGVQSVKKSAIVQSINAGTRTIVVLPSGEATASTYKVGAHVSNFDRIKAGDKVDVTIAEELAVYLLRGDQLPAPSGAPETIVANARVLSIDSSYRLLKVQYSGGRRETFKVGLEVDLREMQAGDSVVIRTGEAVALRVRKS